MSHDEDLNGEESQVAFVNNMESYIFRTDSNADILEEERKVITPGVAKKETRVFSAFRKQQAQPYESMSMSMSSEYDEDAKSIEIKEVSDNDNVHDHIDALNVSENIVFHEHIIVPTFRSNISILSGDTNSPYRPYSMHRSKSISHRNVLNLMFDNKLSY